MLLTQIARYTTLDDREKRAFALMGLCRGVPVKLPMAVDTTSSVACPFVSLSPAPEPQPKQNESGTQETRNGCGLRSHLQNSSQNGRDRARPRRRPIINDGGTTPACSDVRSTAGRSVSSAGVLQEALRYVPFLSS